MLALYRALNKIDCYPRDLVWLKNKALLDKVLKDHAPYVLGEYLHEHFVQCLSDYVNAREDVVTRYIQEKIEIDVLSADFIDFCFEKKIFLDKNKVLQSFEAHDDISHQAVLSELDKLEPKENINLLGFGLDTGYYEKIVRQYLLDKKIAKTVQIFGYDPYADLSDKEIIAVSQQELDREGGTKYDVIIARWVLHHVEVKERWKNFITSLNHCNDYKGIAIVVEHGYLSKPYPQDQIRLYKFLVATFDILANIGIRPQNFINTTPPGLNFYVDYLNNDDLTSIDQGLKIPHDQKTYDVGPDFPAQTLWVFRMK
jgi:hypothetical protein